MKNQVIEVLNQEHGKKVIEYWKSIGIDTTGYCGCANKMDGSMDRFYGVINGAFDNYEEVSVIEYNAEIIELPEEKTYPRVMMVSFNEVKWYKRVVFMEKCGRYLAWNKAETIQDSESIWGQTAWDFAKDIEEPKEQTITLSGLNSKMDDIKKIFGISENDKVVIKLD
ncbi:MAG: hypothetical protein AB7D38_12455 [Sulfurimonas sp.]|uniref:hypothetical protein n=1 Tax=Sulfurimonas sp. TaxID=2022749 RepID=UPI003D122625